MKRIYSLNNLSALCFITLLMFSSNASAQCNPDAIGAQVDAATSQLAASQVALTEATAAYVQARNQLTVANERVATQTSIVEQRNYALAVSKNRLAKERQRLSSYRTLYASRCDDPTTHYCVTLQTKIDHTESRVTTYENAVTSASAELTAAQNLLAQYNSDLNAAYSAVQIAKRDLTAARKDISRKRRQLALYQKQLAICCKTGSDFDGDGHSSVYCGGDDCDDQNATVYPGAPELCNDGLDNDCDGDVDESDITASAGSCAVSYYGYGPEQGATLTASASGGSGSYTYSWSNGSNTQSIDVDPSETTTYTVTVTDSYGCTAEASVTVNVIDVRCGKKNDKVSICHATGKSGKTNQLCISANAVKAHLKHGDVLGSCGQSDPCGSGSSSAMVAHDDDHNPLIASAVSMYPNPASSVLTLEFDAYVGDYNVRIIDGNGREIANSTSDDRLLDIDVSELVSGLYYITIQTHEEMVVKRFTIVD